MKEVVKWLTAHAGDELPDEIIMSEMDTSTSISDDGESEEEDPLYEEARELVIETGKASASFLQRRLKLGYARAARLIDEMEKRGVVGPGSGAKAREVYGRGESVTDNMIIDDEPDEIQNGSSN